LPVLQGRGSCHTRASRVHRAPRMHLTLHAALSPPSHAGQLLAALLGPSMTGGDARWIPRGPVRLFMATNVTMFSAITHPIATVCAPACRPVAVTHAAQRAAMRCNEAQRAHRLANHPPALFASVLMPPPAPSGSSSCGPQKNPAEPQAREARGAAVGGSATRSRSHEGSPTQRRSTSQPVPRSTAAPRSGGSHLAPPALSGGSHLAPRRLLAGGPA
jgi:hypothetical protein